MNKPKRPRAYAQDRAASLAGRSRVRFAEEAPVLLSVPLVCEELSISRSTFYDWRAKGRAPRCVKLPNGRLRVRRADLDHWLTGREG